MANRNAPEIIERPMMTAPERLSMLTRIALLSLATLTNCDNAAMKADVGPIASASAAPSASSIPAVKPSCPPDMVNIGDAYCIDRFETAASDETNVQLSPYYPPHPWHAKDHSDRWVYTEAGDPQRRARLSMMHYPWYMRRYTMDDYNTFAVSQKDLLPNANTSFHMARQNCENSGKRLCTEKEWKRACRGEKDQKFPYGNEYQAGVCNSERQSQPKHSRLYRSDDFYLSDPRLNLLEGVDGEPLLEHTGALEDCVSSWGTDKVYDLTGNLAEWAISADGNGEVMGGHYFANTKVKGCAYSEERAEKYYDYSLGGRCCADLTPNADQTVTYKISPHHIGPAGRAPRRKIVPGNYRHYCPTEMVKIGDNLCIDAYEAVAVTDAKSEEWTSPYYSIPALPSYQFWHKPENQPKTRLNVKFPGLPYCQEVTPPPRLKADSEEGLHPNAYLSYSVAGMLCQNAGKRLCTPEEWKTACMGKDRKEVSAALCNIQQPDPSTLLYGEPNLHGTDPRHNFAVKLTEDVLILRTTGEKKHCISIWPNDTRRAVFDMIGNLSEWTTGAFLMGGAYSDQETEGCRQKSGPHPKDFYDYRTGVRCCLSLKSE